MNWVDLYAMLLNSNSAINDLINKQMPGLGRQTSPDTYNPLAAVVGLEHVRDMYRLYRL